MTTVTVSYLNGLDHTRDQALIGVQYEFWVTTINVYSFVVRSYIEVSYLSVFPFLFLI